MAATSGSVRATGKTRTRTFATLEWFRLVWVLRLEGMGMLALPQPTQGGQHD